MLEIQFELEFLHFLFNDTPLRSTLDVFFISLYILFNDATARRLNVI